MPQLRIASIVAAVAGVAFVIGCQGPDSTKLSSRSGGAGVPGGVWLVEEKLSPQQEALEAKLQSSSGKVSFKATPLQDVMTWIRDSTGIDMDVRWSALKAADVDNMSPITAELKEVTYASLLRIVLAQAGGEHRLDFIAGDGVLTVSTADDLECRVVARVYYVGDILAAAPPAIPRPDKGYIFATTEPSEGEKWYDLTRDPPSYRLAVAIRSIVEPGRWRPYGENDLIGYEDRFVIVATPKAHRQIALLLSALRGQTPKVTYRVGGKP